MKAYEEKTKNYIGGRFPAMGRPQWIEEKVAVPDPDFAPVTESELNEVYKTIQRGRKMSRSQVMNEFQWESARRMSAILSELEMCYSVEETTEGGFVFYQATALEPIEDIPKFKAPPNKYRENQEEALKPIPKPSEVAPSWWHSTYEYKAPRSLNTPVESEEEELTGTEKKEIMLAALVQYGCMSISEISEKAPELTPGEVRSLGMGLENQGLVRRTRRREGYSYVDCYEACV